MNGILISIVLILVIVILAGYVLNSLGPTIFKTKQVVEQFGNEIEQQNKKIEKENLLNKIKTSRDLSGLSISGLDLSGYDFSGKNLSNVNFDLTTNVFNADFRNTNLSGTVFETHVSNADFTNTDLRKTSFLAKNKNVNFEGSNFSGNKMKLLECKGCNFSNSNLSYTVIERAVFNGSDFTNADVKDIRIDVLYHDKSQIPRNPSSFFSALIESGQYKTGMCEYTSQKGGGDGSLWVPLDCTHSGFNDWCPTNDQYGNCVKP
jgi:hypothetical protein